MSRPAIIVMAKAPRAGRAKTRLVPPLTHAEASELAACFLRDTVASAHRVASEVFVAYTPREERATLEAVLPGHALWIEQRGSDLGARLDGVAEEAARLGLGPFVIVGADSPTLPHEFLQTAIESLESRAADIALGPTDDGGFYAVALQRPAAPELFHAVAWSTPRAFRETSDNAARLGLTLAELPRWYDIDTPDDLRRLRAEFSTDEDARLRAPATFQWLSSHPNNL